MPDHCRDRLTELLRICDFHDHDGWNTAQYADVFEWHMRSAVCLGIDPWIAANDLDILLGISHRNHQLVTVSSGYKGGKAADDRNHSAGCHARRNRGHIRLSDADIERPLGKLIKQRCDAHRL